MSKNKVKELQRKARKATGLFDIKPATNSMSIGHLSALIDNASKYLNARKEDEILILDESQLKNYIDVCLENGVDALDTETTGVNVFKDTLAGVCIYTPSMPPAYIPINHIDFKTNKKIKGQLPIDVVKQQLKRIEKNKHFYHTAKFELKQFIYHLELDFDVYWDCYICAFFTSPDDRKGLKYLYEKEILGMKEDSSKSYGDLFGNMPFTKVPLDIASIYAAGDAYKTYELGIKQLNQLQKNKELYNVYKGIELPLVKVVTNMELQGVDIDMIKAQELSIKYNNELKQVQQDILDILKKYGVNDINLSSPQQLKEVLIDIMKVLPNNSSTDVKALNTINHPIGNLLLKYRGLEKIIGTYVDKFPLIREEATNRIHAEFKQLGTDTGRFASKNPNMQNIPSKNKEIRQIFIPPKGYVWLSGDYSKQEPLILSEMAGDITMSSAYMNGQDVYVTLASRLYNLPEKECMEFNEDGTKNIEGAKRRSNAKSLLLGIMYGMGPKKLAESMKIPIGEAKQVIQDFKKTYPKIIKFVEESEQMALTKGYVTTICGRRRYLPDIQLPPYSIDGYIEEHKIHLIFDELEDLKWEWDKKKQFIKKMEKQYNIKIKDNGGFIATAKRQAVNSRIQGSAADITKLAMLKIGNNIRLKELEFKMILTAHDELIGVAPIEHSKECARIMEQCMVEAPIKLMPNVRFKIDIEVTDRWYGKEVLYV